MLRRLPKTATLHQRQFHKNSRRQKTYYIKGRSGFETNLPCALASSAVDNLTYFPVKANVYRLLGNGEISQTTINTILGKKYEVYGAYTYQSLSNIVNELKEKVTLGDTVVFDLGGHGSYHNGMRLSSGILTPSKLQSLVETLSVNINIAIIIKSCYSGQFLKIKLPNTSVYTSSNCFFVSYYNTMEADSCDKQPLQYFNMKSENLAYQHAIGNIQSHPYSDFSNYFATNTLIDFLDTELNLFYDRPINQIGYAMKILYQGSISLLNTYGNLITLPTMMLLGTIDIRLSISFIFLYYAINLFQYLLGDAPNNKTFYQWNESMNKAFINRLEQRFKYFHGNEILSDEAMDYLLSAKQQLNWIFIKLSDLNHIQNYSQNTVLQKALIFISFALYRNQFDKIDIFIKTAKQVIDPEKHTDRCGYYCGYQHVFFKNINKSQIEKKDAVNQVAISRLNK